jgi:hypothetical protein
MLSPINVKIRGERAADAKREQRRADDVKD